MEKEASPQKAVVPPSKELDVWSNIQQVKLPKSYFYLSGY
jgi:hypothetical protein